MYIPQKPAFYYQTHPKKKHFSMRRMNNLITLFSAMFAFFFGCFLSGILTNVEKCASTKSGVSKMEENHDVFMVVLILSAPSYFERRQIIRDTWLKLGRPLTQPYYPEEFIYIPDYDEQGFLEYEGIAEQSNRMRVYLDWMDSLVNSVGARRSLKIKHYFAIGTEHLSTVLRAELKKEKKINKDLLLLPNLKDSYSNLTEKLLHSIDAITNHNSFSYLLKVDDDTYVKLDYLLNELVSYDRKLIRKSADYRNNPLPELYWGFFNGRANIKTKGQWRESHYNLCNRYIPYALGGGYVITHTIAEFININSKLLSTFISEDASLGTWLAPLRNIYRKHDVRFDTGYMPRKCRRQHIILHKRSQTQMKDLFEGKLCTFEDVNEAHMQRPAEYYYDWKKSVDKCCDSIAV